VVGSSDVIGNPSGGQQRVKFTWRQGGVHGFHQGDYSGYMRRGHAGSGFKCIREDDGTGGIITAGA
jgi:hypothetical protein